MIAYWEAQRDELAAMSQHILARDPGQGLAEGADLIEGGMQALEMGTQLNWAGLSSWHAAMAQAAAFFEMALASPPAPLLTAIDRAYALTGLYYARWAGGQRQRNLIGAAARAFSGDNGPFESPADTAVQAALWLVEAGQDRPATHYVLAASQPEAQLPAFEADCLAWLLGVVSGDAGEIVAAGQLLRQQVLALTDWASPAHGTTWQALRLASVSDRFWRVTDFEALLRRAGGL